MIMRHKKSIIFLIIFVAVLLASMPVVAYLLDSDTTNDTDNTALIGSVNAYAEVFFEGEQNGEYIEIPAKEVIVFDNEQNPLKKSGVYEVNTVDESSPYYIEKLRLRVKVTSNVESYIRLRIIEQHTIKKQNANGETELSVIRDRTIFNFENTWNYISEDYTDTSKGQGTPIITKPTTGGNYYYYMQRVKGNEINGEIIATKVNFITSYFADTKYDKPPIGSSLQLKIVVEAVQALNGPQRNWNLENPPWNKEANW